MTLSDALDELRNGILRDSSTLKSGPPDAYWPDDRLVRYIDDAHKRFARLSLCIRDSTTPSITQVNLANAIDTYGLDPSVLGVVSARHQDDAKDLVRITHLRAADTMNTYTEDFEVELKTPAGKPSRFTTDEGMDPAQNHAIQMRFVGTPDTTQVGKIVYLRVVRKPKADLTLDDTSALLETPAEYDLDVLEWAAYRALRNWDIDAEDRTKSKQHRERFEEAVAECKKDVARKMWQPYTWRFGGNGFGGHIKN